jgi:transcriptional regulator with XRE-family HTH domain
MAKKRIKDLVHPPYTRFQGFLKENRITLKQVAAIIGSTVPTVSTRNNGRSDYSMTEINSICDALGCNTDIFRTTKVS